MKQVILMQHIHIEFELSIWATWNRSNQNVNKQCNSKERGTWEGGNYCRLSKQLIPEQNSVPLFIANCECARLCAFDYIYIYGLLSKMWYFCSLTISKNTNHFSKILLAWNEATYQFFKWHTIKCSLYAKKTTKLYNLIYWKSHKTQCLII